MLVLLVSAKSNLGYISQMLPEQDRPIAHNKGVQEVIGRIRYSKSLLIELKLFLSLNRKLKGLESGWQKPRIQNLASISRSASQLPLLVYSNSSALYFRLEIFLSPTLNCVIKPREIADCNALS
jgi:hypothetical protein